jgi:hypothetical protein
MGFISSALRLGLTCREEIVTGAPFASDGSSNADDLITHYINLDESLSASSSVVPSKGIAVEVALIAGAKTLDLTALSGTLGSTVTMSGLKLQHLIIKNKTGNGDMVFTEGATNGYEAMGNAWKITLKAGQYFAFNGLDLTPDVSGSAKDIDVTGTGTQSFQIFAIFG